MKARGQRSLASSLVFVLTLAGCASDGGDATGAHDAGAGGQQLTAGNAGIAGSSGRSHASGGSSGAAGASSGGVGAAGGAASASGGTTNGITGGAGGATGGAGTTSGGPGFGLGGAAMGGSGTAAGRAGSGNGGAVSAGQAGTGAAGSGARAGRGGANAGGAAGGGALAPVKVFIAGDSTASTYTDTASTTDQAGWGQMLGALFGASAQVENHALGGRTARRFIDEGHLDEILAAIHAGDFLLVQFGTNDSNKTATYSLGGQDIPYYLEPETDFKTYMQMYIDAASAHGVTPALVTPTPRNSAYCTGGNGTGAWATALRELGSKDGVAVLDLNQKTVDYLKAICPSPTPEDFFLLKSDGSVDGTHFQENGARILSGFVADEMRRVTLPLAAYLK